MVARTLTSGSWPTSRSRSRRSGASTSPRTRAPCRSCARRRSARDESCPRGAPPCWRSTSSSTETTSWTRSRAPRSSSGARTSSRRRRHRVATASGGSVRSAAGSGKGRTPLRRWPPDLHPPKSMPRESAAAACGGTARRQRTAAACGGIAWRQRVAAVCDRRRGVGKGGRRYDGGPRTCIHRRRCHASLRRQRVAAPRDDSARRQHVAR